MACAAVSELPRYDWIDARCEKKQGAIPHFVPFLRQGKRDDNAFSDSGGNPGAVLHGRDIPSVIFRIRID
jgi:hypothetical protein